MNAMNIKVLTALALAVSAARVLADSTNNPVKIGAAAAAQHYDERLTVTGTVSQVSLRPTIVFINLDHRFPDSPMAAVIHAKDTNQFANLRQLEGKQVESTGKIVKYRNRPEMVLEKASQLLIVGGGAATNAPAAPSAPAAPKGTNDLTTGVM